ncbi:SdrD B-like domain-containing protein, partial [Chromatium okenii]|uniref:SdrD B-like domain-containing protein n=1 Tax=Chromatium okenii TaxID=61644 RepID=UPI0026EEA407
DYLDGKDTASNGAVITPDIDKISVTLAAGDDSKNNNFGELPQPAQLSGYVYEDAHDDGVKGVGETAIGGVTVTLLDADGNTVATATTDDVGYYEFTGLAAGTYTVVESQPDDYLDGKDTASNGAVITPDTDKISVTLIAGDDSKNNNFGELLVGVDIEKYVRGSMIETNTSGSGSEGFSPGFWKNHACSADLNDWEPSGYKAGDSVETIFGINLRGTPTLLNALSTGGGGVDALLRQSVAGLLNASNPNVDYKYSAAEVIQMTKTAVNSGNYTATKSLLETENSKEGDLSTCTPSTGTGTTTETAKVDADDAPGILLKIGDTAIYTYEVKNKNTGDVALDNVTVTDDKIASLTFVSGDTNNNNRLDVTETWVYTASETVTAPGLRTNIGTVVAKAAGKTVTDSDAANYTAAAPPVVNNASLGDYVWLDKDGDGVQDTGEVGIAKVKVTLTGGGADGVLDTTGDNITKTTTTDTNGKYSFTGLAAGEYQVTFDASTAGSGYVLTAQNAGSDDAKDSDANTSTGKSEIVTLDAGEADTTIDAGVYQKAKVGDKVWDDQNHNYIQDSGELGVGGVTVKLYGVGADGVINTTDDTLVATTTTGTDKTATAGQYEFSNLDPGTYVLEFNKENVSHWNYNRSNNMSDWKWAPKDAGSNDAIDSDVAGNGVDKTDVTKTDPFTLVSGQNDKTKDAGITPIVIDLNGDGIHTIARTASTATFDLFGNGTPITSGWLSADDGFLAVDSNHNGKIDGISELFGGLKKGDGFAKLSSFDSTGNGIVDAADVDFSSLSIWRDINGNHATDDGELFSLAAVGVTSLKTSFDEKAFIDVQGNLLLERSSATFADGHLVEMTDVYFNVLAADAAAADIELIGLGDLAG